MQVVRKDLSITSLTEIEAAAILTVSLLRAFFDRRINPAAKVSYLGSDLVQGRKHDAENDYSLVRTGSGRLDSANCGIRSWWWWRRSRRRWRWTRRRHGRRRLPWRWIWWWRGLPRRRWWLPWERWFPRRWFRRRRLPRWRLSFREQWLPRWRISPRRISPT